jgi:hypothetical protein
MEKKNRYTTILPIVLALLACKSSNAPDEVRPAPQLPSKALIAINGPVNAPVEVDDYFADATAQLNSAFTDFERAGQSIPAGKDPQWKWTSTLGTWYIIITANIVDEGGVAWTELVDFNEEGRSNWTRWTGTIRADGATGTLDFYAITDGGVVQTATWTRDDQDLLTVVTQVYEVPSTDEGGFIAEVTAHPDGAVEMAIKTQNSRAKFFEAVWDVSGAGSWISYDRTNGQQTGSGDWD